VSVGNTGLGQGKPNPFSPGFGKTPERLVGRDDLLSDIGEGLATGPRDERFASILMGVRGSGKTALLNEIEQRAAADGWVVISLDASSGGDLHEGDLLARLRSELSHIADRYPALDIEELRGEQQTGRSAGFKLGPLQGQRTETHNSAAMNLRQRLTYLSEAAQRYRTSVLLTVDELHTGQRDHLRRLANDLQHITSRAELPLAFIGAGLLEMQYTILQDKKMTFLQRSERYKLPELDYTDALAGLRHTINDAHGEITEPALRTAATAVNGSPYRLQVIGHRAWKLADAPNRIIDETAVEQAVDIARGVVKQKVNIPALYDITATERQYLSAVVQLGAYASKAEIGKTIKKSPSTTKEIHRRLFLSGYVTYRNETVGLTDLVPASVVRDEMLEPFDDPDGFGSSNDLSAVDAPQPLPLPLPICREWMPRAKARCVLNHGHQGACRSKKPGR